MPEQRPPSKLARAILVGGLIAALLAISVTMYQDDRRAQRDEVQETIEILERVERELSR